MSETIREMMMRLQVTWVDMFDILFVAAIIYAVLALLIGTRAIQLVKGLFLLLVLFFVAKAVQLRAMSWLLTQCVSAMLLMIPIIFQPELRKLLEELGRHVRPGRQQKGKKHLQKAERLSDEVYDAIMYCCEKKIGALIVFEHETGLGEYWHQAVHLNADITKELLISIFWVNNPLHDGAVIIDRDKIIAAACYLPLTENERLSRWYGTRHRAAVGVSEVSDAICLVVSEERGEVTLATHGNLSCSLKPEYVKRYLVSYFSGGEEQGLFESLKDELRSFGAEKQE